MGPVFEYKATTPVQILRHKRKIHLKKKRENSMFKYPWYRCEYAASTPFYWKLHTQIKHDGITYPCMLCENTYSNFIPPTEKTSKERTLGYKIRNTHVTSVIMPQTSKVIWRFIFRGNMWARVTQQDPKKSESQKIKKRTSPKADVH